MGIAFGCYLFIIQIYVGEIATDKNRGSLLNFIHIFVHLGVLFVYILGQFVSVRTLNIVCGIVPLLYAIGFQLMPESVPFLVSKRNYAKAEHSMLILCKKDQTIVETELWQLKKKNENRDANKKSLGDLLKDKSTKKAIVIMTVQFFFFQMCGTNAVNLYAKTIFTEAKINIHPGLASIINAFVLILSAIVSVFYARKFGRRPMLLIFNSFTVISLIGLGTYFSLKSNGVTVEIITWLPLVSLCVSSISFCLGIAPVI